MLQTRIPNPREIEPSSTELLSLQQAVSSTFALVGRQYPLMIFTLLLCVSWASVYLLTLQKRYTSTADMIIDSRRMQGLQTQQGASGNDASIDSGMVDSQVEILKSETIAQAVIKDLRLTDDAEVTGPDGGLLASIAGLASGLVSFGPSSDSTKSDYRLLRS